MKRPYRLYAIMALLAGGIPVLTFATCSGTPYAGGYSLFSTNDNLLSDTLDFLGNDGDDDDDD